MAQTLIDAFKSMPADSNPDAAMLLESIVTSDEMFGLVPWKTVSGSAIQYEREKALPTVEFVSDTHTSLVESTGTVDEVTVGKREIASDYYIRNAAVAFSGAGGVSPVIRQRQMKLKAAGQTIAQKMITGGRVTGFSMANFSGGALIDTLTSVSAYLDSLRYGPGALKYTHAGTLLQFRAPGDVAYGAAVDLSAGDGTYTIYSDNPSKWIKVVLDVSDATGGAADTTREITFTSSTNEFDGLGVLMHPAQVYPSVGADGDELGFGTLDRLRDMVKTRGQLAYLMPAALRRKLKVLQRAGGGVDTTQLNGRQVMAYDGVPILLNDWIPTTEAKGAATTLSSVYLVDFAMDEGVYMIATGGQTFDVRANPNSVPVMGFQIFDLGQIQASGSMRGERLCFYGALAMGSYLCAARSSEIITA